MLFFFVLMIGNVFAITVHDISSCQALVNNNSYYRLQNDVAGTPDFDCFIISGVENITLDLQGHTIYGGRTGIVVMWSKNWKILNGVIDSADYGINALSSRGSAYVPVWIEDVLINNSYYYGIMLGISGDPVYNVTLINDTFINSRGTGYSYDSYSRVNYGTFVSCNVYHETFYPLYGGTPLTYCYLGTCMRCPYCWDIVNNICITPPTTTTTVSTTTTAPAAAPACQVISCSSISSSFPMIFMRLLCGIGNFLACNPLLLGLLIIAGYFYKLYKSKKGG
jgi:hypothetical protein